MSDLISRSAVLEILSNEFDMAAEERAEADNEKDRAFNAGEINCARRSTRKVKELPAIDAVPVVRCKDCALHGHCAVEDMFTLSRFTDGYCRAGKRVSNVVSGARMDGDADG